MMSDIVTQRVSNIMAAFESELAGGATIISVDVDIARVRILPLGDRHSAS